MRVLVLCKRQYTGKDLLDDRYGRLYELPVALAARGHKVGVLAWSYRRRGASQATESGVTWQSIDAWPTPLAHRRQFLRILAEMRPEVIWASSDAMHALVATHLGRAASLPVVIDLYDDYEAFGLTLLPGLRRGFRRACAAAASLSVVSQSLAETVRARVPTAPEMELLANGVSEAFLAPRPRDEGRRRLGLPQEAPLVGTAGALEASRGIDDLFRAFRQLRKQRSDVRLVVAGPRDRSVTAAFDEGVIDLGVLSHAEMPWLFSALDVGVVCNRDSLFGRACHPQKLVEMVACGLPVVAAAVGDAARRLQSTPSCLYPPGDARALAARIGTQLDRPIRISPGSAATWPELAGRLEALLQAAVDARR